MLLDWLRTIVERSIWRDQTLLDIEDFHPSSRYDTCCSIFLTNTCLADCRIVPSEVFLLRRLQRRNAVANSVREA